ncbi:YeeE/YedE family protein [Leucothrix pacifica]|uniref:YeeE/YedE family protein n=1 Tax=Leucothrix pacifica TaxID=1247513 RepID=A0A317C1Z4_9GAMM|nr:YeeE/YedE thiosulfate transporter family protein [Leucothrix pacifica]PWQ92379.1 YeeE/YedE family protein [Leucothrix pacifica]
MNTTIVFQSLLGGTLIGVAAVLLMLTLGRISGVSGITSGLLSLSIKKDDFWRIAFILGLVSGPLLLGLVGGEIPEIVVDTRLPYLIAGGLLVGFGATLGSGCASGHGVCGIARISPRSLLATGIFVAAAVATVFFTRG